MKRLFAAYEKSLNDRAQILEHLQGAAMWGGLAGLYFLISGAGSLQEGDIFRGVVTLVIGSFLAIFYALLSIAVFRQRRMVRSKK